MALDLDRHLPVRDEARVRTAAVVLQRRRDNQLKLSPGLVSEDWSQKRLTLAGELDLGKVGGGARELLADVVAPGNLDPVRFYRYPNRLPSLRMLDE